MGCTGCTSLSSSFSSAADIPFHLVIKLSSLSSSSSSLLSPVLAPSCVNFSSRSKISCKGSQLLQGFIGHILILGMFQYVGLLQNALGNKIDDMAEAACMSLFAGIIFNQFFQF